MITRLKLLQVKILIGEMMDCEYKIDNRCVKVEEICGIRADVDDTHCQHCVSSSDPKGINRVTVSLAIYKTREVDKQKSVLLINKYKDILITQKVVKQRSAELGCGHRGQEVGDVDCKCQGKNKVYTCTKHGLCAIRKMVPGTPKILLNDGPKIQRQLHYCIDCEDISDRKGHCFDTVKPDYYHTTDDLILNAIKLASNIAAFEKIKGVAGVPRSGLTAASAMASHLGVPLYYLDNDNKVLPLPNGARLLGTEHQHGKILIVDDSANSGQRMRTIRTVNGSNNYIFCAVYSTSKAKDVLDYVQVLIDLPHWFEWWFYGCSLLYYQKVATDFDGIICEDCPPELDDDGQLYTKWMMEVKPIRHFYPHGVPYVITARLEKYAELTRWWLERNQQVVGGVVHAPYKTKEERSKHSIAHFKAQKCKELGVEIFIESEPVQAMEIASLTDKPVICPKSRKVYNFEKGQYIFR